MSALYDVITDRYGDPAAFIGRLRSTMLLHGISQGQLARRSGYHRPNITRWLGGHQRPSLRAMTHLDEALDTIIHERSTTASAA